MPEEATTTPGETNIGSAFQAVLDQVEPNETPATPETPAAPETKPEAKPAPQGEKKEVDPLDEIVGAKKPEAKPEEDLPEAPAGLTKGAKEGWTKFRETAAAKIAERDAKIAELQKIAESASKTPEIEAQLQLKDKELAELKERWEKVAFETSPQFVKDFVEPVAQAERVLGNKAKELGLDSDRILSAHRLTGKARGEQLDELLSDVSSIDREEIVGLLKDMRVVEQGRAEAVANHRQVADQYRSEAADAERKAKESTVAKQKAQFAEIADKLAEALPFLRKVDGADAHNAFVDEAVAKAGEALFGQPDFGTVAKQLALGHAAPRLWSMLLDERKARKAAEEAASRYSGADTSSGGDGQLAKDAEGGSWSDRVIAGMEG